MEVEEPGPGCQCPESHSCVCSVVPGAGSGGLGWKEEGWWVTASQSWLSVKAWSESWRRSSAGIYMAELELQAWRFGPWPQCTRMYSTSLHDTADVSLLCRGEPEPEASLALFCTSFPPLQSDEGLRSISIRKLVPTSRQTWNFLPFVKLEMAFLFLKCKLFPSYNLVTIIFEDSLLFKTRQTSKCFLFLHHLLF